MGKVLDTPVLSLHHICDDSDWNTFYSGCSPYLLSTDYTKLKNYLHTSVKAIVIEKEYLDKDYRSTYYNYFSKKFFRYPANTIRVHFFSAQVSQSNILNLEQYDANYIGYTIIRPTKINSIGRTILDPTKLNDITGHLCITKFRVHILGSKLTVQGFPYISQDSEVNVCAHAAIWMVFRYFSEKYNIYKEILPFEISQLTKNISYGRLIPSKGITMFQISEIFSNFGFYPEIYHRDQYKDSFERLLYYYLESGLPITASLKHHAITILGHCEVLNNITFKNTSENIAALIINDDNHLPYQVIAEEPDKFDSNHKSGYRISDIDSFVVPLYEKMYLSAEYLEQLTDTILDHSRLGVNALSKKIKADQIIKRIFLTSSKSFKSSLVTRQMPCNINGVLRQVPMPKFIWVCELATKDSYASRKIVGEILFDATANHYDVFAFLSIHYPDFIITNKRNSVESNRQQFDFKGAIKPGSDFEYSVETTDMSNSLYR